MLSSPPTAATTERVALVTGGAVRIGRAVVEHLVSDGYRVWIHCFRSRTPAEELAESIGDACLGVIVGDLSVEDQRVAVCQHVIDGHGPANGAVSLLVNNAASFESGRFLDRNDGDLRRVLESNLVAPMAMARRLSPTIALQRGAIINICDAAAYHPWRGYVDHCTAKAGLLMATRGLALELAPDVRVCGVSPGTVAWPTDPEFAPGSPRRDEILKRIPLGRIGEPADIARAVVFLAAQPHITGEILVVDGGSLSDYGR